MRGATRFLSEHLRESRRHFLAIGAGGLLAGSLWIRDLKADSEEDPEFATALSRLDSLFTKDSDFKDVSRGTPTPHTLPEEKKQEVGMTRETWTLEITSDPEHPVKLGNEMSQSKKTALDFPGLMQLANNHAVRFAKVMTCLNVGCPLGMGIWEGVPLREIIWRAEPRDNLRRVIYFGYHNDKPEQMFRSSLPIGRVFEDPFDLPPVILCYKLNGEWLSSTRGGPVRVVVPEAYGFKSIKWLSNLVLSNLSHANDTYAEQGNDIESPLKTFAATLAVPTTMTAGSRIPLSGYAQVGISGLSKVQVWFQRKGESFPKDDRYFASAPWVDMTVLPHPEDWGGGLPANKIPVPTIGFDDIGRPIHWPMRLSRIHWAGVHNPLEPGEYTLRCRSMDEKRYGQPMPRPFRRSGHAAIEQLDIRVT